MTIKKILLFLIGCLLITSFCLTSAFANTTIKVSVDEKNVSFDVSPYVEKNGLMLPARQLSEALGAKVEWDAKEKTAWIHKGMVHIEAPLGETKLYIHRDADFSGIPQKINLTEPIKSISGRIFLPADTLVDCFGLESAWDEKNTVFIVKTQASPPGVGKVVWAIMDESTVKSMELFNLDQEKIRDLTDRDMEKVMTSFNEATLDQNPYIQMITGDMLRVALTDGRIISFTSYGSNTNVVAAFKTGETYQTYHLVAPEIAQLLLQEN